MARPRAAKAATTRQNTVPGPIEDVAPGAAEVGSVIVVAATAVVAAATETGVATSPEADILLVGIMLLVVSTHPAEITPLVAVLARTPREAATHSPRRSRVHPPWRPRVHHPPWRLPRPGHLRVHPRRDAPRSPSRGSRQFRPSPSVQRKRQRLGHPQPLFTPRLLRPWSRRPRRPRSWRRALWLRRRPSGVGAAGPVGRKQRAAARPDSG